MSLVTMQDADFASVYSLMETSFPAEERREREAQRKCGENPAFTTYLWKGESAVKGFITVYDLQEFFFVEHFAVNPAFRNQGLGSEILTALREKLPRPLVLEVELPETEFARRRIEFYRRNGFVLHHYPYMQPPYSPEKPAIPLLLMATESISEETFHQVKTLLYTCVYGVSPSFGTEI